MFSNALELLGVACIATFLGFIWWPAALIPIGMYLLITGYALDDSDDDTEVTE